MAAPPPAAAAGAGAVQSHSRLGWHFEAHVKPLARSEEIDELAGREQLCKVPDIWCGGAALRAEHSASGVVIELNGLDALLCCRWEPMPPSSMMPSRALLQSAAEQSEGPLLGAVRCQFADGWKPSVANPDVKELRFTSDWTCFTPYWGTTRSSAVAGEDSLLGSDSWEVTEEELPMDLLRRQDEIHWYQEVLFWEDELEDNGGCRLSVRIRVMPTFWFALFLCEMRVDNVLLREVATRFFGSFESDYVLREWTWKEASYEALKLRGVNLAENPNISHSSIGTTLLGERDVRHRLRHRLQLHKRQEQQQGSSSATAGYKS